MRYIKQFFSILLLLCLCTICAACGHRNTTDTQSVPPVSTESISKGSWDSSLKILVPSADGISTKKCNVSIIDYSNASEGYIMVNYTGSNPKVKLQITGPDDITYTYNLHGDYEVFPLTSGSGKYQIGVYENIEGTKYAPALTSEIKANITNEFGPYLYPNQYVNFCQDSLPAIQGEKLAYNCNSDIDVVETVYNFIIENFSYDYDKASTVQSGYIPDVDEVFNKRSGICFDYASVTATMLRSQGIPTRLEVGYIGEQYHAWISTYIQDVGWVNGIIEFDGTNWNLMDPTFASTSQSPTTFTAENNDYLTKYVY